MEEVFKYKHAIESLFGERGCSHVSFEISRDNGVHPFLTIMPIPLDKAGQLEGALQESAKEADLPSFEKRDKLEQERNYIRVFLYVDAESAVLTMPLPTETRVDLQICRKAVARILDLEHRIDWKRCVQPENEEVRDAAAFKTAFAKYDFSIE